MTDSSYKAKTFYQDLEIARKYDHERISSWHGRLAHSTELKMLKHVVNRYFRPGSKILDLPCGTGRLLDAYGKGMFTITCGDISEEMLKVARRRSAGERKFTFLNCSAENLPFPDNTFDYLVSFRFMCHLPLDTRRKVLSEMARVTKRALAVNYHFDVRSPLMIFNKLFRKQAAHLPYPLRQRDLGIDVADMGVEILEVSKLSWWERSSAMVLIRKHG